MTTLSEIKFEDRKRVYLGVSTCDPFFVVVVSLALAGVWLLFNGLLAVLFSLFCVIGEFERFLLRG